jgi:serine/threonine protein kinase
LDQDYEFICHLGKGNFSSVGLYMSKVQGQKFAIKQNKTSSMSVNEIQALATLSIVAEKCPNIIRYYHAWVEKKFTYMVMEYCETSVSKQYDTHRKSKKHMS